MLLSLLRQVLETIFSIKTPTHAHARDSILKKNCWLFKKNHLKHTVAVGRAALLDNKFSQRKQLCQNCQFCYHSQAKPSLLASLGGRKKAPFLNAKKGVSRELKKCTFWPKSQQYHTNPLFFFSRLVLCWPFSPSLQLKLPLWASNFVCDWTYDFGQHYGAKVKMWCRQGSPNKSKTYKFAQGDK